MLSKIPLELQGAALAIMLAVLRVLYNKEETKPVRILLEAAICGGLSVTASAGIVAFGLSSDWSLFAGGAIGYLGTSTVRAFALRFIGRRVG